MELTVCWYLEYILPCFREENCSEKGAALASELGCQRCCPWWGICIWVSDDLSSPLSEDPLSSALNMEAQVSWVFGFYLGVGIRSLFPVPLESEQVSPASHLRCILSRCRHGKKANYLFVCGPGLWGYMPFSLQWICATFQGLFCLHDGNIVFFSH